MTAYERFQQWSRSAIDAAAAGQPLPDADTGATLGVALENEMGEFVQTALEEGLQQRGDPEIEFEWKWEGGAE